MSYGPPPGPPPPGQPPYGGGPGGYGPPSGPPAGGPPPEVGLVGVILSLLCCWPLGIPALVFQLKIDKQWQSGDYAGAQDSAKKATTFRNIAFVLGSIAIVVGIAAQIFSAVVLNDLEQQQQQEMEQFEQDMEDLEDLETDF